MDARVLVVLVLGLIAIGLAAYYLFVFAPQQELLQWQREQAAQEAQIQAAIAYCQSIGQQYDFGTGGCQSVPITTSIGNWVGNTWNGIQTGWSNLSDYFGTGFNNTLNPLNPNSAVSQSFGNLFNFVNPFNPNSFWANIAKTLFGG